MSIYGALNTAISGLTAQSAAFTNISDNVANSQTVGFKRTDTAFIDYLTTSNQTTNQSGSVTTLPIYINNVQGTVQQSDNPLALAITGQGFFPASQSIGIANGNTVFDPQQYYTRSGDFSMNAQGYLVNSAGLYLNGWTVNSNTGVADQTTLAPIQISQSAFNPIPTTSMTVAANLPATPTANAPVSSDIQIYDGLGTQHTLQLDWTQNAGSDWTVSVVVPDNTAAGASSPNIGTANVKFGSVSSGNAVPDGTVGSLTGSTGITANTFTSGQPANLSFTLDFGNGPQTVNLSLGNYGQSNGVTQYAGTTYDLKGVTQNGVAAGSFSSVSTQSNGDIVLNYSNGQSRTIAQVPVATFNDPNQLQRHNGQSFTATQNSGAALEQSANSNGAGSIVTTAVEQSNVDIATEFSKLIVAQQAYTANAKVVTSANQLLTVTIDMKQ